MDVDKLVRRPEPIKAALVVKGKKVITRAKLTILIPEYFTRCGLASIGKETWILGVYAIANEASEYAISNVPAMLRITPTFTRQVKIDDMEYLAFEFEPGSVVIENTDLEKNAKLVYPIFNDLLSKGRVPFQLTYEDAGMIFAKAERFAGTGIVRSWEVIATLLSLLARDPRNPKLALREVVTSFKDVDTVKPFWSPIRSVQFLASNTINKLAGSRFQEGTINALTNPTEQLEPIDRILRI